MKLPAKQQAFVREYLIDLNATAAAARAGYKDGAYGRQLLTLPNVADVIQAALARRAARTELTQDYVLNGLRGIADDSNQNGAPRVRALELLGKHQGMFVDRVDHTSKGEQVGVVAVNVYMPSNGRDQAQLEEKGE